MLNPLKLMAIYRDLNRVEGVAKEKATMQGKISQYVTLVVSLFGTIGVPSLATGWLHAHVLIYTIFVAVAIVLHAALPSLFSTPGAENLKATGLTDPTAKLGVVALCSLLLMNSMVGCSASSLAQDIVNWTPTVISTAQTVTTVVGGLDPAIAPELALAVTAFDVSAQTLANQAEAYLKNPSASLLQALQAQVTTFQQSVNAAVLQAIRITDPGSQQKVLGALQALSVGVNAILALVASIKGNTVSAAASAVKLAQLEPYLDRSRTVGMVAAHYGESQAEAAVQVDWTQARLAQAGF